LKKVIDILFRKGSKSRSNSTNLHILTSYLTLEILRQENCPKYNGSSILLCHTSYFTV